MLKRVSTMLVSCLAILAAGCSTYVENEASLEFEPIYPAAHVTP